MTVCIHAAVRESNEGAYAVDIEVSGYRIRGRRLHVIGEATEGGIMPTGVEGIPARSPKAIQTGHVNVMKASGMQRGR